MSTQNRAKFNTNSPFNSKLIPHFELIRDLRIKRKSWKQVAQALAELGVITSASNAYEFFKRHRKRPAPLGFPEESQTLPAPAKQAQPPSWMQKTKPQMQDLDFSVADPTRKFTNP